MISGPCAPQMRIVLMGDHVTALPEESLRACPVDFVVTGGDFDLGLLTICEHLRTGSPLEPGIWWRDGDALRDSGPFTARRRDHGQRVLVDRELTKWWLYGEHLFYKPCTYTMVGRDCWRPRCPFCSWTTLWPRFGTRTPESLLDEIELVTDNLATASGGGR